MVATGQACEHSEGFEWLLCAGFSVGIWDASEQSSQMKSLPSGSFKSEGLYWGPAPFPKTSTQEEFGIRD